VNDKWIVYFIVSLIGHWSIVDINCYVCRFICLSTSCDVIVCFMLQVVFVNILLNELCIMHVCSLQLHCIFSHYCVMITLPPGGVRSIVMNMSVCLFVCLSTCITLKLHGRSSPNFSACYSWMGLDPSLTALSIRSTGSQLMDPHIH